MQSLLTRIFDYGALIFAFGFIAPLIAQVMMRTGVGAPFGMTHLAFGLLVAGVLGVIAQIRGRWL